MSERLPSRKTRGAAVRTAGAISALGIGPRAFDPGAVGEPPRRAQAEHPELVRAGLRWPHAGAARGGSDAMDRASWLLAEALRPVLDDAFERFGSGRIGLALATSSGGMRSAEKLFAGLADPAARADDLARHAARATYFDPVDEALAHLGRSASLFGRRAHVLTACSASTIALGIALRWLEADLCDVVVAGGYDALSPFVAAGFEGLRATTKSQPQPFRTPRDGMFVGEGAGAVLVERAFVDPDASALPSRDAALWYLRGFAASADAVHITAPDRTGAGLARAAEQAIGDAGVRPEQVQLVSAHGTSTPFNDSMEAKAIARAVPGDPVVHAFKAQIGHTLGAAGILETLAAAHCLKHGLSPATPGDAPRDPDAPARTLSRGEASDASCAVKLSAAFGGANAAVVIATTPGPVVEKQKHAVFLGPWTVVDEEDADGALAQASLTRDRWGRLDGVERLALTAVGKLAAALPPGALRGAGVVVGHALATLETNARFARRLRERGAPFVEARLFPATSPNACAGQIGIAFEMTGLGCAVGGSFDGGLEALSVASLFVQAGDAGRVVVVAVDEDGDTSRRLLELRGEARPYRKGAVAALLTSDVKLAAPHPHPVDLDGLPDRAPRIGHLGLLDWLSAVRDGALSARPQKASKS